MKKLLLVVLPLVILVFSVSTAPASADWGVVTVERVSVASDGTQGDNSSDYFPSLSSDGRLAAFDSYASNLVPGDTNGVHDIFVRDRIASLTSRVSVSSGGLQANGKSLYPTMSADGRYVAFQSTATNLVPDDTNGAWDIFVNDRWTGSTNRVSIRSDGSQANGDSRYPTMSADGRFVAFQSTAPNLVPGDTNAISDVFVRDRATGVTTRVSVSSNGVEGNESSYYPSIDSDGRFLAFSSSATNLVPGDSNNTFDVFVKDRQTGATSRVSIASTGAQGNGPSGFNTNYDAGSLAISGNGRFVAFISKASNLVPNDTEAMADIFVHDTQSGITERVSVASDGSQANYHSNGPTISDDGRYVAFVSDAFNLVPADTNSKWDIFAHDREMHVTVRVSVDVAGVESDGNSSRPSISGNGQFVAFQSYASNLVPADTNGVADMFVAEVANPTPADPVNVTNVNCLPKFFNPHAAGATACSFTLNQSAWAALIVLDVFGNLAWVSPVDIENPFPSGDNNITWIGQLLYYADGPYIPIIYAADADGNSAFALDPEIYVKADNGKSPQISNLTVTPSGGSSQTIAFDVDKYHTAIAGVLNNYGQWVRLLAHDPAYAGQESFLWDGKDAGGNQVPPGTYWFIGAAIDSFGRGSGCYTSASVNAATCFTFTAEDAGEARLMEGRVEEAIRSGLQGLGSPADVR